MRLNAGLADSIWLALGLTVYRVLDLVAQGLEALNLCAVQILKIGTSQSLLSGG